MYTAFAKETHSEDPVFECVTHWSPVSVPDLFSLINKIPEHLLNFYLTPRPQEYCFCLHQPSQWEHRVILGASH